MICRFRSGRKGRMSAAALAVVIGLVLVGGAMTSAFAADVTITSAQGANAIQSAVQTAIGGGDNTVNVTGTGPVNIEGTITLNIPSGKTVKWAASITGIIATANTPLFDITGAGTFEVSTGGSITAGNSIAIRVATGNAANITVSGGTVTSAAESSTDASIFYAGSGTVTVSGDGAVKVSGTNAAIRIVQGADNATVNITGGTVERTVSSINAPLLVNGGSVNISGGTVKGIGGGAVTIAYGAILTVSGTGKLSQTSAGANKLIALGNYGNLTKAFILNGSTAKNGSSLTTDDVNLSTVSGNLAVIWNGTGTSFTKNSADGLSMAPTTAGYPYWHYIGTESGIKYGANNNDFLAVDGVTIAAETPEITTQPNANYTGFVSGNNWIGTLSVVAKEPTDGGTLTYQWYVNTTASTTGGSSISGATQASYTPSDDIRTTPKIFYYYVVVTNTNSAGGTASVTSSLVEYKIAPWIEITTQPQNNTYVQNTSATALTVGASVTPNDNSVFSYQWYSNIANTNVSNNDVLIDGETGSSYTPSTATAGTLYYFVKVTVTYNGTDGTVTHSSNSTKAQITVTPDNTPPTVSSVTPSGADVAVSGNVVITFNEAMNATAGTVQLNNLTALSGGAWSVGNTVYTIPYSGLANNTAYTVNITNFKDAAGNTMAANSAHSFTTVVLVHAATPTISAQPTDGTYTQGDDATALSVTASKSGDGTLSYQWYSNTANNTTGGTTVGTNSNTYKPSTAAVGTTYYYVVVTNTNNDVNGNKTAIATSNTATVTVNAPIVLSSIAVTTQPTKTVYNERETLDLTGLVVTATYSNGNTNAVTTYTTTPASGAVLNTAGTQTVTISYTEGSVTKTATFTVTVNAVVDAATPNITAQPAGATYTQNTSATALSVTATRTDGGTLSYQWYSNNADNTTSGTPITGETNATYTPVTSAVGTLYYYVIVTNTNNSVNGNTTATATSNTAAVTVNAPPTVTGVTVSPATVSVQKGTTQPFVAVVTGTNSPAQTVTWAVSGGVTGTAIDTDGELTVAAGETAATLTVTATSTVNTSISGTATVTVTDAPVTPEVINVTVTPATASVEKGATHQFAANVSVQGGADQAVTWSVSGGVTGTSIATDGTLTVATDETATTLTVTATSTADNTKTGTATVAVTDVPVTTYAVTVTGGTGGGDYAVGATVTVTAGTAPTGQEFKNWATASAGVNFADANSATTTFTMPANAVTVTAVYEDVPPTTVNVTNAGIPTPTGNGASVDQSTGKATITGNSKITLEYILSNSHTLDGKDFTSSSNNSYDVDITFTGTGASSAGTSISAKIVFGSVKLLVEIEGDAPNGNYEIGKVTGNIDGAVYEFAGLGIGIDIQRPVVGTPVAINIAAIPGVTAPVRGAAPVTAITPTAQYTGVVSWSPAVTGSFAASTRYTATITLTPKDGYTLTGVAANFFTVAGAATVTNSASAGVVTAVFPATGSSGTIYYPPSTPSSSYYTITFNANGGSVSQSSGRTGTTTSSIKYLSSLPTPTRNGYKFDGWFTSASGGSNVTVSYGFSGSVTIYAHWTQQSTGVLEAERVVPNTKPNEEAAVIAPVTVLSGEFTAGPNPVGRELGSVGFFRQGKRVSNGELRIYDATGNVVGKVKITDNALGNQARRKVGSWDLKDKNGRTVSEGTYLVKGKVTTSDGKSERVSVIVGVR